MSASDVHQQSIAQEKLKVDLALLKAENKRLKDELSEMQQFVANASLQDNMSKRDVHRVLRHNAELQRLVESLTKKTLDS